MKLYKNCSCNKCVIKRIKVASKPQVIYMFLLFGYLRKTTIQDTVFGLGQPVSDCSVHKLVILRRKYIYNNVTILNSQPDTTVVIALKKFNRLWTYKHYQNSLLPVLGTLGH